MQFKNLVFMGVAALSLAACSGKMCGYGERDQSCKFKGPIPGSAEDFAATVTDRVFFGFDTAALSEETQNVLDKQIAWLKTYPSVDLLIEGHCDSRGTREYNLALGERRANAVRKYVTAKGIEAKRLHIVSYGKERLQVEGDTDAAHAKNRVTVSVVQ